MDLNPKIRIKYFLKNKIQRKIVYFIVYFTPIGIKKN